MTDYEFDNQAAAPKRPPGVILADALVTELRRVVAVHGLRDATIAGVPMSAILPEPPPTRRESMAACLLASDRGDLTWRLALDQLRAGGDLPWMRQCWRLADAALEHIPYLDRLPVEEAAR